eukprot:CAMPEP_0184672844 /NCGR_PEP_ID=MMETSP0308-20130426/86339_1 /TAXON_ID=38269 /ORGANISM="Gloeochaete witrockiana, Strain SAG 46.84" /LENGTH=178 /DNA_ID=CAMNT_0027120241 /DNA_START=326 /DNA_END=859 /DNA_ORIENTATION=+
MLAAVSAAPLAVDSIEFSDKLPETRHLSAPRRISICPSFAKRHTLAQDKTSLQEDTAPLLRSLACDLQEEETMLPAAQMIAQSTGNYAITNVNHDAVTAYREDDNNVVRPVVKKVTFQLSPSFESHESEKEKAFCHTFGIQMQSGSLQRRKSLSDEFRDDVTRTVLLNGGPNADPNLW